MERAPPTGSPKVEAMRSMSLWIRGMLDVVGVPLRPVVGQGHFPALPESCLVAVLTRPSGTALWG